MTVCGGQQSVLGFWANWQSGDDESTCTFQACIGSSCTIFNAIQAPGFSGYEYYSFAGPTYPASTTVTISVSASEGAQGNCNGFWILFDDFTLL